MLVKTGEVSSGVTICDQCSKPATTIVGSKAFCEDHVHKGAKQASEDRYARINAITSPLTGDPDTP